MLSGMSALTFGVTCLDAWNRGMAAGWHVALAFLGGALVPYVVAAGWMLLVAPPDLLGMWRDRRRMVREHRKEG